MNKSEELARLLGIEPKIKCKHSNNYNDRCSGKYTYCDLRNIKECPALDIGREIYPDFTNPRNSIKLLNLLLLNNFSFEFDANENAETQIINTVINMNKYNGCERIKPLAQQVKWSY